MKKRGFTLIELLIVIALLGALAVGLLATVDPFEQLKKGSDTSIRNTAAELFNAFVRYYSQRGGFPTSVSTAGISAQPASNAVMTQAISDIAAAGELKSDFINLAGITNLGKVVVSIPQSDQVIVCVQPQSKAFRNDKNTIFNNTGGAGPTYCPNATATDCYVCFQ